MADHEIILEALQVLEAMTKEVEHGKDVDFNDIRSLLGFLREFADGSHHVKEEAILFPALIHAGMTLHEGPLRVMTYEHERGRSLTAAMEDALARTRKDDFVMYARRYIELLRDHIEKENYVLFEMADRALSDEEDETLAEAMEEFESTTVGVQTQDRLHRTIENLASRYLAAAISM